MKVRRKEEFRESKVVPGPTFGRAKDLATASSRSAHCSTAVGEELSFYSARSSQDGLDSRALKCSAVMVVAILRGFAEWQQEKMLASGTANRTRRTFDRLRWLT